MRSPLQGGLPPAAAVPGSGEGWGEGSGHGSGSETDAVVEIACDESGFSGTNLLHSPTPLFTHASVDLRVDEASALITALRAEFRFSPAELKAGRFLRGDGAGEALEWVVAGLRGRALIHLIDKEFFLVTRIVDLLLAEPSYAAGTRLTRDQRPAALALYRAGRRTGAAWTAFLAAFVELVRIKRRQPDSRTVDHFFQARDALARDALARDALDGGGLDGDGLGGPAEAVLAALSPTRVAAVVARLFDDDRSIPPPLEPLLPALAETVLSWSDGRRRVLVVHDEQSALTADRLTRLQRALINDGRPSPGALPAGLSPLAGLTVVDSRDDPRVQVADLLAGAARRMPPLAEDAPLWALLSPTADGNV